jgi:hypothetical protein
MTGDLVLRGAPTSNLMCATKAYVDSAVSSGASGSSISTSGGYSVVAGANDV